MTKAEALRTAKRMLGKDAFVLKLKHCPMEPNRCIVGVKVDKGETVALMAAGAGRTWEAAFACAEENGRQAQAIEDAAKEAASDAG